MTWDVLAFTLAALDLAAAFGMLMIGLGNVIGPPVATRCGQCSRWMTHLGDQLSPRCMRCRLPSVSRHTGGEAPARGEDRVPAFRVGDKAIPEAEGWRIAVSTPRPAVLPSIALAVRNQS
ncbi:hypothetical protein GL305_16635 [Nocardia seriolae]|uniref:Uncharacterized protein n=1 Tax=Nocardia seriolae TaxID=37332 RepID=A0A0B8NJN0_9NOCA|nr:hypothetical protein [Nocardia seriolae]APA97793.1 hypothetical protein NS506_03744 [Nocardia seriolae]MTJ64446.1 hypothetical protein [Nocardia seriolae]MTJ73455.1 hypothetical protein [Nocardia seriolae]MTJ87560.1 hypothetical protein [Nocardia seriolae]MTK31551.1 hypothetical protein [Nocardia seriolae]